MAHSTSSPAESDAAPSSSSTPSTPSTLKLSRNMWRMPLLRGLLLVVLGVLLLVEPLSSLENLVRLFGAFLLLDAIVAAVQGLLNRDQIGWRWWLVQGAVDAVFAILIVAWPSATALVLFYLLVIWTLVLGVVSIIGGVALIRNRDLGWSWLLTIGLLSTLFGLMLVTRAEATGSVLDLVVVVFGLYAFVVGAVHIVSVFSMRWVAQEIDRALEGRSLVATGVAERRAAAQEASAARSAERKAAKVAAKTAGAEKASTSGRAVATATPTRVRPGRDGVVTIDDGHPRGTDAARSEEARVHEAEEARERVVDDELAALAFPDAAGMGEIPVVVPVEDEVRPEPVSFGAGRDGSGEAEGAAPGVRHEGVAHEGDDVEDRVRHDERHDPSTPPA